MSKRTVVVEPEEPAFAKLTYTGGREALWAKERHRSWIPWNKPAGDDSLPIDDEIAGLIDGKANNAPRIRPRSELQPLGQGTAYAFLQGVGELAEFCPYREMRAHWIPFALQVARIEAERRRRRIKESEKIDKDVKIILAALKRYSQYDPDALARTFRPLLSWPIQRKADQNEEISTADDIAWTKLGGVDGVLVGPREEIGFDDVPEIRGIVGSKYASWVQKVAAVARARIEACRDFSNKEKKSGPSRSPHEWQISFAATLGFAWRRLTGRNPSSTLSNTSPFQNFVESAYLSLGPAPDISWSRPCHIAVLRYADEFFRVDQDSTLMVVAPEVWRDIPFEGQSRDAVTDYPESFLWGVIDKLRDRN